MKTTLASGYITLLKTSIGSGILSFPYLFKTYGIVTGIAFSIVSAGFSVLGLFLYAIGCNEIGRGASLSVLADRSVPHTRFLVDCSVFLKCFGVAISYLIITKQLLPVLLATVFGESRLFNPNLVLFLFLCVVGPVTFFDKLDKLKYTSLCGVGAVIAVTAAAFYRYEYTTKIHAANIAYLVPASYEWLGGFGKFVFAYTCHQNIFIIHSEMEDNSLPRMKRLIFMVAVSAIVIYLTFGYANYMLYGDAVRDNVLENYPNDVLASIVRGLYVVVMGVSYPLQVNPCRRYFINMLGIPSKYRGTKLNASVTLGILIATLSLAVSGMGLGLIYSLIGATASTFICLIFPALIYMNLEIERNATLILLSYLAFLYGIFVFSTSIFSIIKKHL
jgi:amino acid permease